MPDPDARRVRSRMEEPIWLPATHPVRRWPPLLGGLGLAGMLVSVLLGSGRSAVFWHAYLVAFLFVISLSAGGLFFVLLHFVTRAGWSVVVRRLAEHVAAAMPFMALLAVPLFWALPQLYPWARPDVVAADQVLKGKEAYLNTSFFSWRALFYLISWSCSAWWLRRKSLLQDRRAGNHLTVLLQQASAPLMVLLALTSTFAGFDWIMSLTPRWFSSIFGVYFFSGCVVGIFAFLIILAVMVDRGGVLAGVFSVEHLHDMGKLLFAFVVFWAYIGFSQFLLIWYAGIPEETIFYATRLRPGWYGVTVVLALGHFVLPFFLLLSRHAKRRRPILVAGSIWMLAMHYLDLYWLVMPGLDPEGATFHLLDLTCLAGFLGLFLASVAVLIRRAPVVPVHDPRLPESIAFENV
ncbi:MAG: quinol:cytochrome C oxidoreductase [Acidobacteriota bacterium]